MSQPRHHDPVPMAVSVTDLVYFGLKWSSIGRCDPMKAANAIFIETQRL